MTVEITVNGDCRAMEALALEVRALARRHGVEVAVDPMPSPVAPSAVRTRRPARRRRG
jgi:hypothetical protein